MDKPKHVNPFAFLALLTPFLILSLLPWSGTWFILFLRIAVLCMLLVGIILWKDHLIKWLFPGGKMDEGFVTEGSKYQDELDLVYSQWVSKILTSVATLNREGTAALYFYDPGNNVFTLQSSAARQFHETLKPGNRLVKRILSRKKGFVFQEKDVREEWKDFFIGDTWRGSECLITAPIPFKNHPAGFLLLWVDHFNQVNPSDRTVLAELAGLFATGLERIDQNEKLIFEILLQERIIDFLYNVNIRDPLHVTLNKFIDLTKSFFNYDQLTISLIDKESGRPMIAALDGPEATISTGDFIENKEAFHHWVYRNDEILHYKNLSDEFSGPRYGINPGKEIQTKAVLTAPVREEDRVLGMLVLERVQGDPFTERDRSYIAVVASILAHVVPDYNTFQQVQRNATHDGLTGLLSRRVFDEKIRDELARGRRFNQFISLVIFDLDKFKRINDQYGHVYGDYVIKTTAQIIKSSVRNIDIAARYGGEEFVLILVNTDKKHSNIVVNRIINSIADYDYNKEGIHVKMTISAGIADFPEDAEDDRELIKNADIAMYRTKKKGGNGMTTYDSSFSQ